MVEPNFNLTPEKRALLEALLKEKALQLPKSRAISPRKTAGAAPLSFAQLRMWFFAHLEGEADIYNVPSIHRIRGALDIQILEDCLNDIIRRHEALRTTFEMIGQEVRQVVAPQLKIQVTRVDLRAMPVAEREAEVRRLLATRARQPFDLARGPLLRVDLFESGDEQYYLLINIHHIIIDEWSLDILFNELRQWYAAKLSGQPASIEAKLPVLSIQYSDFAVWQAEWLQSGVLDKQLSYWKEKLSSAPPLFEINPDFPRPAVLSHLGADQRCLFPQSLLDRLHELSKLERVTLFTTLLAAFQVLLYRYTGQTDVLVGVPITNRRQIELENLIGFFLNMLVVRGDLSGLPTFRQFLGRFKKTVLEAFDNQDLPFEKLVEELNPQRDSSRHPLFQISFVLNSATAGELQLTGLQTERLELDYGLSKFDLSLFLVETPQGLQARLEYNTDLFLPETMARLLNHYGILLESIVANPDLPIDQLQLLSKAERDQVLFEWNITQADYPRENCVHQLFERQVQRTPEAIALTSKDQSLTYRHLDESANQLAHYLQRLGVGPDVLVGICLESSPELVIALLGTLKAGGAYVPLDPNYPEERLAYMLSDAQASVLLTRQGLLPKLENTAAQIVCLDADWPEIAQESQDAPESRLSVENLAYVIYTSGSTGKPKGAMISHRALCNHMSWMQTAYPLTPTDRVLQKTLITFDASVWEFYAPLLNGAQIITIKPGGHREISYLLETIQQMQITILQVVPSILRLLVADARFRDCASLRCLFCGGEALTPDLVTQVNRLLDVELINLYGPAEACINAITLRVSPQSFDQITPIGRPVSNTQIYILDQNLQSLPIGVPGEIYLGGDNLGRGYWCKPELTAVSFIPNPFRGHGERIYRTGDRGRFRADGVIEYLGRLDDQVKLAGARVELAEIEAVLLSLPGVQQAAVIVRDMVGQSEAQQATSLSVQPAERRLEAYVVLAQPNETDLLALRRALRSKLPEYMLPSSITPLPALPLSPNGKVDRKALPVPKVTRSGIYESYSPPRDALEHHICQIWEAVMNVHPVGVYDNFFELGGHSLLAVRLAALLEEQLGQRLPLGVLFQHPTVAGLAETLRQTQAVVLRSTIPRRESRGPAPMSFGQERLWFLDRLGVGAQAYNVPATYRIRGALDIGALEHSLNWLIRRHEIMRTRFVELEGEGRQVVLSELSLQVNVEDLSNVSPGEREQVVESRLQALGSKAFDLETGPAIRVHVLRLADQDHILLINQHHIITDEWSSEVFNRELATLYPAYIQGVEADLPELPFQYSDYAAWQIEQSSSLLPEQLSYWKQKLAGAPQSLDLPTDHPRPASPAYRGRRITRRLSREILRALQRISRDEQVTLFVTLLAAFQVLLYRYSGQEQMLIGSPVANRRQPGLENLIGFFLNTLVFRADLKGRPSFRETLRRAAQTVLEALDHPDLPFEKLVEELKPPRDQGRHPLFQTMFVFHPRNLQRLSIPGLEIDPVDVDYGWSKFDLTLFVTELTDGLDLWLEYSADLFDTSAMERLLEHFELLLAGALADPNLPVSNLPILLAVEQEWLLTWNSTRADYPDPLCVHQLFERQAEKTPEALAVELPGKAGLSYAELNRQSNRLARRLHDLGVVPDAPVGIYLERSTDLIVAVLGILKAGGTCLPLDPGYPQKRLEYICADARMDVVVTHRSLQAGLPASSGQALYLDDESFVAFEPLDINPLCRTTPENLAYVLYTSGSTGQPKGVMMRHRPLVNLLAWQMRHFSATPEARTLQLTSLSFDVSFQEILVTLSSGGCLTLVDEQTRKDLPRLLDYIRTNAIERLFLPFIALQALAETACNLNLFPASLREVITAGEQLQATPEIIHFFRQLPACRLHNQYGPTETHVVSSFSLGENSRDWPSLPPIGKPIANSIMRLLDMYGQLAPVGVVGEIYLGGECLARGYFNRPGLTAERFVSDPFGAEGERLYRTGDLGRYLPGGDIQFLGRADQQVKIRGFRVEPAEVEQVLAGHPQVRQAAVLALAAPTGERRLAAYLVAQSDSFQVEEIRNYLHSRLPDYMVPSAFLILDALPLTPSGKIDRLALVAREDFSAGRLQTGAGYTPPHDEITKKLCQIWESVLGIPQIGVDDDFFALGGHSLLAIRLFTQIERQLGKRLPLSTLFEAPTVNRLANHLRGADARPNWSPLVVIQEHGSQPPFFCVHNFGGEVINLNDLSLALGADQPFIGLQAQGLDGQIEPHATIPEMAACYVRAIRSCQPEGPYYLGGFCFGGVVAYEMACQLQAQGQQTALVALFDAYAPGRAYSNRLANGLRRTATFFKNLPFWWRDFLEIDSGERRVVVKRRFTRIRKAMLRILGRPAQLTPRELIGEHAHVEEAPAHVQRLMELHMLALLNYDPPEYIGRVTLFRIQRMPLFRYVAPDAGWGSLVQGGVDIVMIPGPHQLILRPPYVQELAKGLRQHLEQARSS